MTKNREHENVVDSDSDSDNDSARSAELKQTKNKKKKPFSSSTPAAAKKPIQKPASNPSPASAPTLQNGSRKSRTKPAAADPVPPNKSAAKKRPAGEEAKPAKKARKEAVPSDTTKKPLFQRFWLEGDELVILEGMKNYRDQKKSDPAADCDALHNFIKGDLGTKGSIPSQLENKIKKLKGKYKKNKEKEDKMKADGKEMIFSKTFEKRVYDLSKSVWGTVAVKDAKKRTAAKEEKAVFFETEMANGVKTMEDKILSLGVEMFENGKGGDAAAAREWKKKRLEAMEAYRMGLAAKTAMSKLVVDRL